MEKSLITKGEITLLLLMFFTYCSTIYCIVSRHFFFVLIFFIINSCLTILCFGRLLRNHNNIVSSEKTPTTISISENNKTAFIDQASQTIAHLQQANNRLVEENAKLTKENRQLERLVYEK